MSATLLLLVLAACETLPYDADSLVDELRVVAAVASPPEVAPGDAIDVEVHLMDPVDAPRDLLVWFCTPWAGRCAESGPGARPLRDWAVALTDADLVGRERFQVPQELDVALAGLGTAATVVQWNLACRPGSCPVIDGVAADPEPGTTAWNDVVQLLNNPATWLREIPLEESSLAVRTLLLSGRPGVERNRNPTLTRTDAQALEVGPGEPLELGFEAGEGLVFPMASAGAFTVEAAPGGGRLGLRWIAPPVSGRVDLVVVLEDGIGGSAVWRDVAVVR